jgi:HD-GYP domain-containing protein (c-di-GMP phosphodiesterase class II)
VPAAVSVNDTCCQPVRLPGKTPTGADRLHPAPAPLTWPLIWAAPEVLVPRYETETLTPALPELDADRRRNLEFAALLHDVGKIAIPKAIINKPGRLDPAEWEVIKTHTLEGQKMLERVGGFMHEVRAIVRSHHERWDGRGYPDGLAGEDIPLEARIIAICDSWNAMRTNRAYRPALEYDAAVAELMSNSGRQFDPHLIPVFLAVIEPDGDAPDVLEGEDGGAGRVDLAA